MLKPDAPGRRDAQQTLLDMVQAQRIERDVKARKEANPVHQVSMLACGGQWGMFATAVADVGCLSLP